MKDKIYDVYGVGNALVDLEFEVSTSFLKEEQLEKGRMLLVEGDAQERLLQKLGPHHHKRSGGGSAANTMTALGMLGGNGFYSCRVGADEPGRFFADELKAQGLDSNLILHPPTYGVTGQCLVMVTPDAERTMQTHLGVSVDLSPSDLVPWALAQSKLIYLEGYLAASPNGALAALEAKKMAMELKIPVAVTLSDVNMVNYFRAQIEAFLEGGVDLLFANEEEARSLTGLSNTEEAFRALKKRAKRVCLTLGSKGAVLAASEGVDIHIVAPMVSAVDTNGAGDVFAGVMLWAISQGHSMGEAGRLAVRAASLLVTKFGARLSKEELLSCLR